MPNYRRIYRQEGAFFFTLVTHRRRSLFSNAMARRWLHEVIAEEQARHPFELTAIVLLPNHLHCIWRMPQSDGDYSKCWGRIKSRFTKTWLAHGGQAIPVSRTREHHRERGVWQKRFWEHRIRDEEDFIRHVNYIHFNPVKHGHARCPHERRYSSFARWVEEGYYGKDWLCNCSSQRLVVMKELLQGDDFGE